MAQQKDYKVLVVQKVVVPDFAFYKNRYPMGTCVCCSGMESAVGANFLEYC